MTSLKATAKFPQENKTRAVIVHGFVWGKTKVTSSYRTDGTYTETMLAIYSSPTDGRLRYGPLSWFTLETD